MAEKTTVTENKKKALDDAILKIEKSYGKGAIMKLGESSNMVIETWPTGSI
jgi:recombination protein RecA